MLRRRFTNVAFAVTAAGILALVAGCNFVSKDSASLDGVDQKILGTGGAAVMMKIGGQSAMLDGNCVRRSGPTLKAMKAQGSSMDDLRSALRANCGTTTQSQTNNNLARPGRGRLFAKMQHPESSQRSYGSSTYYSWYLDPLVYWSPRVADNRNFCRGLFGWDDSTCFSVLFDFTNYVYYRPYCWQNCFSNVYTAQGASTGGTSGANTTSFAVNKCVQNGCYGQWWWAY